MPGAISSTNGCAVSIALLLTQRSLDHLFPDTLDASRTIPINSSEMHHHLGLYLLTAELWTYSILLALFPKRTIIILRFISTARLMKCGCCLCIPRLVQAQQCCHIRRHLKFVSAWDSDTGGFAYILKYMRPFAVALACKVAVQRL